MINKKRRNRLLVTVIVIATFIIGLFSLQTDFFQGRLLVSINDTYTEYDLIVNKFVNTNECQFFADNIISENIPNIDKDDPDSIKKVPSLPPEVFLLDSPGNLNLTPGILFGNGEPVNDDIKLYHLGYNENQLVASDLNEGLLEGFLDDYYACFSFLSFVIPDSDIDYDSVSIQFNFEEGSIGNIFDKDKLNVTDGVFNINIPDLNLDRVDNGKLSFIVGWNGFIQGHDENSKPFLNPLNRSLLNNEEIDAAVDVDFIVKFIGGHPDVLEIKETVYFGQVDPIINIDYNGRTIGFDAKTDEQNNGYYQFTERLGFVRSLDNDTIFDLNLDLTEYVQQFPELDDFVDYKELGFLFGLFEISQDKINNGDIKNIYEILELSDEDEDEDDVLGISGPFVNYLQLVTNFESVVKQYGVASWQEIEEIYDNEDLYVIILSYPGFHTMYSILDIFFNTEAQDYLSFSRLLYLYTDLMVKFQYFEDEISALARYYVLPVTIHKPISFTITTDPEGQDLVPLPHREVETNLEFGTEGIVVNVDTNIPAVCYLNDLSEVEPRTHHVFEVLNQDNSTEHRFIFLFGEEPSNEYELTVYCIDDELPSNEDKQLIRIEFSCPEGSSLGEDGNCLPDPEDCPTGQVINDDGDCEPFTRSVAPTPTRTTSGGGSASRVTSASLQQCHFYFRDEPRLNERECSFLVPLREARTIDTNTPNPIVTGDGFNGTFGIANLSRSISRQEFFTITNRLYRHIGMQELPNLDPDSLLRFTDINRPILVDSANGWWIMPVTEQVARGVVRGYGDGTLRRLNPITGFETGKVAAEILLPFRNDDTKNPWFTDTQELYRRAGVPVSGDNYTRGQAFELVYRTMLLREALGQN